MTASTEPHASPLAPPPRPLTPAVSRRAWMEPHVRFWWVAAIVLLAGGTWACAAEFFAWQRDVRLVQQPATIAEVVMADGEQIPGRSKAPTVIVRMNFTWEGKPRSVTGFLEGRPAGAFVAVGDKVPLRIDPADPSNWTARTEPRRLRGQLLGGATALVLAIALFAASARIRRGVARTFAQGELIEAMVVSASQTPLAPRSRALRVTPVDGSHNRVFTVYVPLSHAASIAHDAEGDGEGRETLWVLQPPGRGKPVAAAWFE